MKKAQDIRNKDNAAYLELNADLEKAVSSLKAAISSISGSKDSTLVQVRETVRQSLVLADALGETVANTKARGSEGWRLSMNSDEP